MTRDLDVRKRTRAVAWLTVDIETLSPQGLDFDRADAELDAHERELWPGQLVIVPLTLSAVAWKQLNAAKIRRAWQREKEARAEEKKWQKTAKKMLAGESELYQQYKDDCDAKNRE